jgi:hypothetical protein
VNETTNGNSNPSIIFGLIFSSLGNAIDKFVPDEKSEREKHE